MQTHHYTWKQFKHTIGVNLVETHVETHHEHRELQIQHIRAAAKSSPKGEVKTVLRIATI